MNQRVIVNPRNLQFIERMASLGYWSVLEGNSWRARDFDFIELMKKVKEVGFDTNIIFDVKVETDPSDSTRRVLQIDAGDFPSRENHDVKSLMKYRKKMFEKSSIFIDKIDAATKARIQKEMDMVLGFEFRLATIAYGYNYGQQSNTDSENYTESDADSENYTESETDSTNHTVSETDSENHTDRYLDGDGDTTTIKELQESYPYLNWLKYINAILPSGLNVTENERIENVYPEFFEKLGIVLKSTSPRTMANYILWRAVYQSYEMHMSETGKDLRDKCIQSTVEKFTIPVGLLYSRKYFDERSRQAVNDLLEDVRGAFINLLGEVTWMDDDTREKAIAKAKNIIARIGYPNKWYEEDADLSEYYEDLEMEPDNFFNNSLRWNLFNINQKFKTLRKPVNRSGWESLLELHPFMTEPSYSVKENSINFPVAIVHELFFSVHRPQYINYAKLGYIIGHEITHGFVKEGSEFDLNGIEINWWTSGTTKNVNKKAKCIINQYDNYTDPKTNLSIDGTYTLSENIADMGGTRASYNAYQNWIKRNGPERRVPGVKYNQNQLFWISLAQAHSSVDGEMLLRKMILNDSHSPSKYRVNGVFSHSEEFARDFNCVVGTNMNPKTEKCSMW